MTTWIIEPRDPLIVRDGRPFGPDPGARAESLPFPFPSTTTGGVRTQAGRDRNGVFPEGDRDVIKRVLDITVRGPLLVELDDNNDVASWLFPAPTDALLLKGEDASTARLYPLMPLKAPPGAQTNMPPSDQREAAAEEDEAGRLAPVGLVSGARDKPFHPAPRFWKQDAFYNWLQNPGKQVPHTDRQAFLSLSPADLGHAGPLRNQRLHVRLEPETLAAMEGFLFLTEGREFVRPANDAGPGIPAIRMGLAVETEAKLAGGFAPLGGERRLMRWSESKQKWPDAPEGLLEKIAADGACRLILLTPGYFEQGWRPSRLFENTSGLQPELVAVAIGRPQVVSGWDFDRKKPKPSRRLAPAGSVFFMRLGDDRDANLHWAKKSWMSAVSDDQQSCKDGFGLAVLGVWNGKLAQMKAGGL